MSDCQCTKDCKNILKYCKPCKTSKPLFNFGTSKGIMHARSDCKACNNLHAPKAGTIKTNDIYRIRLEKFNEICKKLSHDVSKSMNIMKPQNLCDIVKSINPLKCQISGEILGIITKTPNVFAITYKNPKNHPKTPENVLIVSSRIKKIRENMSNRQKHIDEVDFGDNIIICTKKSKSKDSSSSSSETSSIDFEQMHKLNKLSLQKRKNDKIAINNSIFVNSNDNYVNGVLGNDFDIEIFGININNIETHNNNCPEIKDEIDIKNKANWYNILHNENNVNVKVYQETNQIDVSRDIRICNNNCLPKCLRKTNSMIYGSTFDLLRNKYYECISIKANNDEKFAQIPEVAAYLKRKKIYVREKQQEYYQIRKEKNPEKYEENRQKSVDAVKLYRQSDTYKKEYLDDRVTHIDRTICQLKSNHKLQINCDKIGIDYLIKLIHARCFYCRNFYTEYNGIDRYCNSKNITDITQLVPCCQMCNMIKGVQNAYEFIGNCRRICINYLGLVDIIQTKWFTKTGISTISAYKSSSKSRTKRYNTNEKYTIEISDIRINELFKMNCTYCGISCANGIDRYDNDIGYTFENSVPCCCTCNKMKLNYDIANWIEKIKNIAYTTHYLPVDDYFECVYCGEYADWVSENDSIKTLCNWCINNLLILGGENYVYYCKYAYERGFEIDFTVDSIKPAEYEKNKTGLYSLYHTNGGVDKNIMAGKFVNIMKKSSTRCKICGNFSDNKMVICEDISNYKDISNVYVACKLCMIIKNGASFYDTINRFDNICDNYKYDYIDEDFIDYDDKIQSIKCKHPANLYIEKKFKK